MISDFFASEDICQHTPDLSEIKKKWTHTDQTRYDKIAGCLFAGALGDALGYAIEFDRWDAICAQYGKNGIQNLSLGGSGKALVSDDTQMTLFTCEGIVLGVDRAMRRGDSDSTGAIAGNIIGAYLGKKQIPSAWASHIELSQALDYYAILLTNIPNLR